MQDLQQLKWDEDKFSISGKTILKIEPLGLPQTVFEIGYGIAITLKDVVEECHIPEGANACSIGPPSHVDESNGNNRLNYWPIQFYRVETKG